MKKIGFLAFVLIIMMGAATANAYSVSVGVGDGLDYSLIQGFGFNVVGADIGDLSMDVHYQSEGGAVPNEFSTGSGFPWDVFKTTDGVTGFDFTSATPLRPGIALYLEGQSPFILDMFVLASNSQQDGKYPNPFFIDHKDLGAAGAEYNYVVPIPSALWLLGTGLVGLIALKRKRS